MTSKSSNSAGGLAKNEPLTRVANVPRERSGAQHIVFYSVFEGILLSEA